MSGVFDSTSVIGLCGHGNCELLQSLCRNIIFGPLSAIRQDGHTDEHKSHTQDYRSLHALSQVTQKDRVALEAFR
jgi:hypothetical protein